MATTPLTLYGRVVVRGTIEAVTGLHVGSATNTLGLAGVDQPIAREPLSGAPYIPGSSVRGKMRALTERVLGLSLNANIGRSRFHAPQTREEYDASPIGRLYGVSNSVSYAVEAPARLVVRDVSLTPASLNALANARTDLPFTELKAEVAIDRVTAEAVARQIERVPAGATFGPAELVYSIYEPRDAADFGWVARGLQLLEDDYLGGHGSRGSGKVRFSDITVSIRSRASYTGSGSKAEDRSYSDVDAFVDDLEAVTAWVRSALAISA